MKSTEVAIIGAGLGGLSAAIHLRIHGFSVTVFEKNNRVGGRANRLEREGYCFDTGPSLLNYPWVFEALFRAAGKRLRDYVELLPVEPALVFRWRDGNELTLSSDLTRLRESIARLEPSCDAGLTAFLHDAHIKYQLAFEKLVNRNVNRLWDWITPLSLSEMTYVTVWRSLYSELGRFFRSKHIKEALGAYAMYLGGSPFDLPGFFSILPYGELAYGLWLPKGGIYGLIEGVRRLAEDTGVDIRTATKVEKIRVRDGKIHGVQLENGDLLEFPLVVSNVDLPYTDTQLLPDSSRLKRRRRSAQQTRMTPGVCTFYWGVQGIVAGLGHHTIFLPDKYRYTFQELIKLGRIPTDIPFYVSVASATDSTLAPEGNSSVFVLVPTPCLSQLGQTDWDDIRARLKTKICERLHDHGILLSPKHIETEDFYSPEDWRNVFSLFDGSAFGAAHTLTQVGPFRAANYCKEIEGLYYTGASTHPGTGLPMVTISGKLTAERILSDVR